MALVPRILAALLAATSAGAPAASAWRAKVDARLLGGTVAPDGALLIVLAEQADLSGARRLSGRRAKGRFVFEHLSGTAARSQAELLRWLAARGAKAEPYWIANAIRVRGGADLLEAIARRPEVARVESDAAIRVGLPIPRPATAGPRAPAAEPWNLVAIGAPDVWAAGNTGAGIVIGDADTGQLWDHPALKLQYRGWDGTAVQHDHNWHDAVHDAGSSNPCGSDAPAPCDDAGHGTATASVAVGDDGAGTRVGVAPGARWIGCRNMDQGAGTPTRYMECFQWFLAPTDSAGANPDPDLAPDVVTNSWDCPPAEGCTTPDILKIAVENLRAAGIAAVFSAGNAGPACGTIGVPGIYAAGITIGASDPADAVTDYSSRGPGEDGTKPDAVAPGDDVLAASLDSGYATFAGTSAAAPHAAGLLALVLSAAPVLSGDVDSLQTILQGTAAPLTSSDACGDLPAGAVPNDSAGWGRIDAAAAFDAVLCPPPTPVVTAPRSVPALAAGLRASAVSRPFHTYAWTLQGGSITSGQGASQVTYSSGGPGTTMSFSVVDSYGACDSPTGTAKISVDFLDAPPSYIFHGAVGAVTRNGFASGCGGGNFCPLDPVTRSQMAVFLLRAVHAPGYKPPDAKGGVFDDVPLGTFLGDWIEEFAAEGYTTGCGNGDYCPDAPISRAAAAVFLLRGMHGPTYKPPAAKGNVFSDVPLGTFLGSWIEELAAEGVTSGCGGGNFCPGDLVSRGEMSAFLSRAFSLP
ncbi:MAG TPA: S8 family serine peptidase [Thermoanaerobaculia bacterium]|nr:S8 family serine peptidase [Thermoanaerobaculia bacterium]